LTVFLISLTVIAPSGNFSFPVVISGRCAKEELMRSSILKSFGGVEIKKMSVGAFGFDPVGRRHRCLKK
jgi:hypothetical protein